MVPYIEWEEETRKAEAIQNEGSRQKVRIQPGYYIHQLRKSDLPPKIN